MIGTFGRAVYILDDIRPLREIASGKGIVLDQKFKVFDSPEAVQVEGYQRPMGIRYSGDAVFKGENKPLGGAILSYYLREDKGKYESLTLHVYDGDKLIRTLKYKAKTGLNRVTWRLRKKGVKYTNPWATRYAGRSRYANKQAEPAGFIVFPGKYKVVMSCGDQKDSTMVTVRFDPRMDYDLKNLEAIENMYKELDKQAEALNIATTRLSESKTVLEKVSAQVKGTKDEKLQELFKETNVVRDSLQVIWESIMGKEEKKQGISDFSKPTVVMRLFSASMYIKTRPSGPTVTEKRLYEQASIAVTRAVDMTNAFYRDVWPEYRKKVEDTDFRWFKEYEPIEVK